MLLLFYFTAQEIIIIIINFEVLFSHLLLRLYHAMFFLFLFLFFFKKRPMHAALRNIYISNKITTLLNDR